jgi:hypothetical protein
VPEWHDLAQALIDARDERVDQLFGERPALLAVVQRGRDLRSQQLAPFGRASRSYAILAQVVAGYVPLPRQPHGARGGRPRAALSVQVVETRSRGPGRQVQLNVIPAGIGLAEWEEFLVSESGAPLHDALSNASREIAAIQGKLASPAPNGNELARSALRRIPRIMGHLARGIERSARQRGRRTRHAQGHRRQRRPVHKALEDARRATDEQLFYDEKRETWIVCGKHGRTHAFNDDGHLVTSFSLPSGGTAFRVRTDRWRPMKPTERARFRDILAS